MDEHGSSVSPPVQPSMTLRPVDDDDGPFLLRLYSSTREDVQAAPLSDEERQRFLDMQFTAQRTDYQARFPRADHDIIVVDGEPAGRIWVNRADDEIRLLDIALLPEHRNRGTGRDLLERLIAEASGAGKPLRHSVFKTNEGALRFYERLGFSVVEDFEMYVLMEWRGARPA